MIRTVVRDPAVLRTSSWLSAEAAVWPMPLSLSPRLGVTDEAADRFGPKPRPACYSPSQAEAFSCQRSPVRM